MESELGRCKNKAQKHGGKGSHVFDPSSSTSFCVHAVHPWIKICSSLTHQVSKNRVSHDPKLNCNYFIETLNLRLIFNHPFPCSIFRSRSSLSKTQDLSGSQWERTPGLFSDPCLPSLLSLPYFILKGPLRLFTSIVTGVWRLLGLYISEQTSNSCLNGWHLMSDVYGCLPRSLGLVLQGPLLILSTFCLSLKQLRF